MVGLLVLNLKLVRLARLIYAVGVLSVAGHAAFYALSPPAMFEVGRTLRTTTVVAVAGAFSAFGGLLGSLRLPLAWKLAFAPSVGLVNASIIYWRTHDEVLLLMVLTRQTLPFVAGLAFSLALRACATTPEDTSTGHGTQVVDVQVRVDVQSKIRGRARTSGSDPRLGSHPPVVYANPPAFCAYPAAVLVAPPPPMSSQPPALAPGPNLNDSEPSDDESSCSWGSASASQSSEGDDALLAAADEAGW